MNRFNNWLALHITTGVSTMWCAYFFAALALAGLPQAITDTFTQGYHALPMVTWISQAFLQLVLLSIIMVGQNQLSAASETRAEEDHQHISGLLDDMREDIAEMKSIDVRLAAIEAALQLPNRTQG